MDSGSPLLSPPGRELLDLLQDEDVTPDSAIRLAGRLRGSYPAELVALALTQQELRLAARAKFSRAGQMLFTRAGLEQASSELTAAHAARRLAQFDPVADLCCGIGGNLTALAAAGAVLAADTDLISLQFAGHNAAVYGAGQVGLVRADVRELGPALGPAVQAAFIDPARRTGGRRLQAGHTEPPLAWCLRLAEAIPAVCIKAAPGLPHALVPPGWEEEFVATGRNLKEALLWSPALATVPRRATVLPAGHTLVGNEGIEVPVAPPGRFLLDPNPAVTRAGLVEDLARAVGAWKIDPMIAFLATDRQVSTPFARTLQVLDSMPWHERTAARRLRELDIGTADIRRRGLAGDVDQIKRRLGLRGSRTAVIVLTRQAGRPWGLICEPVASDGPATAPHLAG